MRTHGKNFRDAIRPVAQDHAGIGIGGPLQKIQKAFGKLGRSERNDRRGERRGRRPLQAAFHLIEQPMEATCSCGPLPVLATIIIAS